MLPGARLLTVLLLLVAGRRLERGLPSVLKRVVSKAKAAMGMRTQPKEVGEAPDPDFPLGKPLLLELCEDECHHHGTCTATQSNSTEPVYICVCDTGYAGPSCGTEIDDLVLWYETKGKAPFPPCCGTCQEQQHMEPASVATTPSDGDCDDAGLCLSSYRPHRVSFLEQQSIFDSMKKRLHSSVLHSVLTKSPKKLKKHRKQCCVFCGVHPSLDSATSVFLQIAAAASSSKDDCCYMCPMGEDHPSPNTIKAWNKELDTRPHDRTKRFHPCCNTCPSQFTIPRGSDRIRQSPFE